MFEVDQECVLFNRHDCYKSIDALSKKLSNAASNDLFVVSTLSGSIDKLEESLDKFTNKN